MFIFFFNINKGNTHMIVDALFGLYATANDSIFLTLYLKNIIPNLLSSREEWFSRGIVK